MRAARTVRGALQRQRKLGDIEPMKKQSKLSIEKTTVKHIKTKVKTGIKAGLVFAGWATG